MICTKYEFVRTDDTGKKWWRAILTDTVEPVSLNISGADVANLNDEIGIAVGSILTTPTSNYIAYEDGVFTLKNTSGGGGGGGGGDLVSVEVDPAIESTPTLASLFPIVWDDLSDDEKENGLRADLHAAEPLVDETEYTITVTPSAGWYVYDFINETYGAQGEAVTLTGTVSEGWLDINAQVASDTNDDPSTKWVVYNISISNEA